MEREALLGRILDPFGGAYAIESLTIDIAKQALSLFQRTELAGGLIAALAAGDIQREISKIRHHKEKLLACGQETMIGINAFASQLAQVPHPTKKEVVLSNDSNNDNRLMIDPYAVEQLQIALRDGVGLADLTGIAYRSAETFQFEPLRPYRASAPFEKIRMASARAANERLKPITALLIQEGCDALVAGRSVLVRQVMASCGFTLNECRLEDSRSQEETYQLASEADIDVLAALDDRYPILAKEVFCELNRNHPAILKMVAGYPVGCVETLRSFGTDDFIHAKGHIVEFYLRHARRLGVNL